MKMSIRRKIVLVVSIAAAAAVIGACGDNSPGPDDSADQPAEPQQTVGGLVVDAVWGVHSGFSKALQG